jgi:hypothetical protein
VDLLQHHNIWFCRAQCQCFMETQKPAQLQATLFREQIFSKAWAAPTPSFSGVLSGAQLSRTDLDTGHPGLLVGSAAPLCPLVQRHYCMLATAQTSTFSVVGRPEFQPVWAETESTMSGLGPQTLKPSSHGSLAGCWDLEEDTRAAGWQGLEGKNPQWAVEMQPRQTVPMHLVFQVRSQRGC